MVRWLMSGEELLSIGIEKIIEDMEKFNAFRFTKNPMPGLMLRVDSAAFTSILWVLAKINESGEFSWSPEDQTFKSGMLDPSHAFFFKFTWQIEKKDYMGMGTREVRYPARFKEMAAVLKPVGSTPRERLFHPTDLPEYTIVFDPHDKKLTIKDNFEVNNEESANYKYRLDFKDPSVVDEPFADSPGISVQEYLKLQIDTDKFLTILEDFKKDKQLYITLLPGRESAELRGTSFKFNYDGEGKIGKATVKDGSLSLGASWTRTGENGYNWEQAHKTYAKYFVLEKKMLEGTASLSEVAEFTRLEDLRNKFTYRLDNLHLACTFFNKADIEHVDATIMKQGVLFLRFSMLEGRIHGLFIFSSNEGSSAMFEFNSEEVHSYQGFSMEMLQKQEYSNYSYLKNEWTQKLISRLAEYYGFKDISPMIDSVKITDKKTATEEEKQKYQGMVASFTINLKVPTEIQEEFKLVEAQPASESKKKAALALITLDTVFANLTESNADERSKRKGINTLQKRFLEHEAKREQIIREGGHDSSVLKEMRAFLKQKVDYMRELGEPIPDELRERIRTIESLRKS